MKADFILAAESAERKAFAKVRFASLKALRRLGASRSAIKQAQIAIAVNRQGLMYVSGTKRRTLEQQALEARHL